MNKVNLLSNKTKFLLLKELGDIGYSSQEIISEFIRFEYGLMMDKSKMKAKPLNAHFRLKLKELKDNGIS